MTKERVQVSMNFSISGDADDFSGFGGIESSGDLSMGLSGLNTRPVDEEDDPYNFQIDVGKGSSTNAPWMTEEERQEQSKPKKKKIKAGDSSSLNKANQYLKKYKSGGTRYSSKARASLKVETLDDLSLSDDSSSGNSHQESPSKSKKTMSFKVPTAGQEGSGGMRRSSALTSLVKDHDDAYSRRNDWQMSDQDMGDEDIIHSFSSGAQSPQKKALPGGLQAFMQKNSPAKTTAQEDDQQVMKSRSEALGNIRAFDDAAFITTATKNEALGNIRGFDEFEMDEEDVVEEELLESEHPVETVGRSEALGNVRGFDFDDFPTAVSPPPQEAVTQRNIAITHRQLDEEATKHRSVAHVAANEALHPHLNHVSSKNEAFGNVRGFDDLDTYTDPDANAVEEVSIEESMGEDIAEESLAASQHRPSPPHTLDRHGSGEYSMDEFEKDEYSMDDFETSQQLNESANSKPSQQTKKSQSNPYKKRERSPRAKIVTHRTSPVNGRPSMSVGTGGPTRDFACQAQLGVDIGIQAEMVPLPPLGMDPYLYHLGLGRPNSSSQLFGHRSHVTSYNGAPPPLPDSNYLKSLSTAMAGFLQQTTRTVGMAAPNTPVNTADGEDEENFGPAGDPEDKPDYGVGKAPSLPTPSFAGVEIRNQINASNENFKKSLNLIREQIDKSRQRALAAQQAMHFQSYTVLKNARSYR